MVDKSIDVKALIEKYKREGLTPSAIRDRIMRDTAIPDNRFKDDFEELRGYDSKDDPTLRKWNEPDYLAGGL